MNKQTSKSKPLPLGLGSSQLFVMIGLLILALSLVNWQYGLKPRLVNEAIMNMQILAASRARSIESRFQQISTQQDISYIHEAIHEMLLLNDPQSGENLFLGVELEVDFDAWPQLHDTLNLTAGTIGCEFCIRSDNPIYQRSSGELVAIIKIYANPVFYQRLVDDIGKQLVLALTLVLFTIVIAWFLTNRLLGKLRDRELNLTAEISERKLAEQRMHQIATYDQLTNLPNRYLLHTEFKQKLDEARRYRKKMAILFFDLDHFKTINDIHGHETGDALLQAVSARISSQIRTYDLLARFGGDEFVMIMPVLQDLSEIYPVVEKVIDSFEPQFKLGDVIVQVTTSVGISIFPDDGEDTSTLLKNADLAMYRAKTEGRNGFHFFTQKMNADLERTQWVETSLRRALDESELELHFQPQQNLSSGRIDSCEALLRWPWGQQQGITTIEFIASAERSGLINRISQWVLVKALNYRAAWRQKGYRPMRIDINVSARDFAKNDVIQQLINIVHAEPEVASQIGIEITENVLLQSNQQVRELLTELSENGIHIAIDDFGTGYSSLSYLKQFPVSGLKIDQSFVHDAPDSIEDQKIMQAIVAVGHGLGISVTIEGVESEPHYRLSQQIKGDLVQGYHISRPLPAEMFEEIYLKADSSIPQA